MKNDFEVKDRDLDRELSSPAQAQVREIVRALPEETLSLTWRSELNTRLRGEIARKRKLGLFGWIWKPAAGVAVAGALAIALFVHPPISTSAAPGGIEKALVNHYVDSAAAREIAVDGATPNESKDSAPATNEWDQEDVGATL